MDLLILAIRFVCVFFGLLMGVRMVKPQPLASHFIVFAILWTVFVASMGWLG